MDDTSKFRDAENINEDDDNSRSALDEISEEAVQVVGDADGDSSEGVDPDTELVERLKAAAEENYDKYLRSVAELENFKKRALKERSELLRYAGEGLARDILQVFDDLTLAVSSTEVQKTEDVLQGVKLVLEKLTNILEQHNIKAEVALGGMFDPTKHEALASQPTDASPPGTIISEFRRAFFFRDKLLRPAQVVVAVAPAAQESETEES